MIAVFVKAIAIAMGLATPLTALAMLAAVHLSGGCVSDGGTHVTEGSVTRFDTGWWYCDGGTLTRVR